MEDSVLVIAGEWKRSHSGNWEFLADQNEWSRVVPLKSETTLHELQKAVDDEFAGISDDFRSVKLSYWPPSARELATGITTPPVRLSNDAGLSFFFRHFKDNNSLNLFASFTQPELSRNGEPAAILSTPTNNKPTNIQNQSSPLGEIDADGETNFPPTAASKIGSTTPAFQQSAPTAIAEENPTPDPEKLPDFTLLSQEDGHLTSDSEGSQDGSDSVVRPRGFDEDFWTPLLDDEFAGSNAPQALSVFSLPPRTVLCSTNDAFDHLVTTEECPKTVWKMDTSHSPMRPFPNLDLAAASSTPIRVGRTPPTQTRPPTQQYSTYEHGSSSTTTPVTAPYPHTSNTSCPPTTDPGHPQRILDNIADEDFDVPPLYDDTVFATDEIPDLQNDVTDDEIRVGKVYANKQDCRIALAIYAIKNRFCFRQSVTTKDSFLLTCVDPRCDWRVRAKELKDCAYYEIREVELVHTCSIETRSNYKKQATSRVIAAVYKAKYRQPLGAPNAVDLQQLLMEELRISGLM